MAVGAKIRSFFKFFTFRFFDLPKRMDDIVIQFEKLIETVHGNNSLTLDNTRVIGQQMLMLDSCNSDLKNERKLRLEQARRFNMRVAKVAGYYKDLAPKVDFINDDLSDKLENILSHCSELGEIVHKKNKKYSDLIERMEWATNNFAKIEKITLQAKVDYDKYIDQLQKDISEFKKTDQAVMRLAHLEERITLMEINYREKSHNGSGETIPRPIRAY